MKMMAITTETHLRMHKVYSYAFKWDKICGMHKQLLGCQYTVLRVPLSVQRLTIKRELSLEVPPNA